MLLKRAQATQEKAERREQEKHEFITILEDFESTKAWRRIVCRALLVTYTAQMNKTIQELTNLAAPKNRFDGSFTGKKGKNEVDAKHLWGQELVPFEEVMCRETLSIGQGVKAGSANPKTCKHNTCLIPRGNSTNLWYTCSDCNTRWPRKLNETVLPPTRNPKRGSASGMTDTP